jgi:hypothetical protein
MNKLTDRASCRKEDERRGDAIECRGSTMQELYETVLGVLSLDGSVQLQRWKSRKSRVARKNSLRDGERRAAGGSSVQR